MALLDEKSLGMSGEILALSGDICHRATVSLFLSPLTTALP